MKWHLLLGTKAMKNLESAINSRGITLPTKVQLASQGYGFSSGHVWMWELDYEESWVLKNWCSWTVVLEKTLENPLDCKQIQPVHPEGDQSWCSLEGLMLKLKLQYFGHLMWRVDSLEKTLMLGGIGGRRRRGRQRKRWLDGITKLMGMSLSSLWGFVIDREAWLLQFMGLQRVGHDRATELNTHTVWFRATQPVKLNTQHKSECCSYVKNW